MAGKASIGWLEMWNQVEAEPGGMLQSLASTAQSDIFDEKEVEIDITTSGRKVAPTMTLTHGGVDYLEKTKYANWKITPPVHKLSAPINSEDLYSRSPGMNPYAMEGYSAKLMDRAAQGLREAIGQINRAMELQMSQLLQTGDITLADSDGNAVYTLDYGTKATHFPTVSTGWDEAGATPLEDLVNLARTIVQDGKQQPNILIFGKDAWINFIKTEEVRVLFDNRRMVIGNVQPVMPSRQVTRPGASTGEVYQGQMTVGSYAFHFYTYEAFYEDRTDNDVLKPYIGDDKVLMLSTGRNLRMVFGDIPNIGEILGQPSNLINIPMLPSVMSQPDRGQHIRIHPWMNPNGEGLNITACSRPLAVPAGLDTFGCLDTNP